jgi:cyclic dehypoxanthinyl futalosine synthase
MGISRTEALDYLRSDDLIGIGMEADAVRRSLHPEGVVTYALDSKINYATPKDQLFQQISTAIAKGATSITLQGEVSQEHTIPWFEALFRSIKDRFPTLWLHSLSATEILTLAQNAATTPRDTIARLQTAGLDSIPGNDAGILDDAVHHQNPHHHWRSEDWLALHRTAHQLSMQTTATMLFGAGETHEHRLHHMESLRQLQQETNGFASFTPRSFTPQTPAMAGFEEATAVEYLKTLAVSRLYLDAIQNVQSDLETQRLKVQQVSLRFGANDAGSILLAQGANTATEEQVRQVIRDAGFTPVQRDALYQTMFLN